MFVSQLREKQVQRIRSIYHRQLSITHSDLKSTLLTYKTWESKHGNNLDVSSSNTDGLSPQVASTYQKALEMLTLRADFEEKIVKSDETDTERLQSFMVHSFDLVITDIVTLNPNDIFFVTAGLSEI